MGRKSEWPKGTEVQRVTMALPRRSLDAAKVRAMKDGRTLQEVVAEALVEFLKKKGGTDAR